MALNQVEKINQLTKEKKNILITFPKAADGDAIASSIALSLFLQKQGKVVDVVCDNFSLPASYKFLKNSDKIKNNATNLQKLIISIDIKDSGVKELSYDVKNEKLNIFVTPKLGFLTRDHIRTAQSDFKYDLIFVLGAEDLNSLAGIYGNNTELFYKTPIVNIDHQSGNEHFGQINLTDLTVTSVAEILFSLMKKLGEEFLDENIATALLTGMIAKTRSFKADNIKPHTLATAGKLMSLGADREKIVTNLYRTRSVSTLKLWGQVLTHMQTKPEIGLVYSTITRDNFVRSGAEEGDLVEIVDELISNSPEAKLTLLLHEHSKVENIIHGILRVHSNNLDAKKLLSGYNVVGNKNQVSFEIKNKNLKQVEEEILKMLLERVKQ